MYLVDFVISSFLSKMGIGYYDNDQKAYMFYSLFAVHSLVYNNLF